MADAHLPFPSFFLCSMKKWCFFLLYKTHMWDIKTETISKWYILSICENHLHQIFTNIPYHRFHVIIIVDNVVMHGTRQSSLNFRHNGKLTFLLAPPRDTLGVLLKSPSKLNMVTLFPSSSNQSKYPVCRATKCCLCLQDRKQKETGVKLMN